jgi:hypothetical protein
MIIHDDEVAADHDGSDDDSNDTLLLTCKLNLSHIPCQHIEHTRTDYTGFCWL